MNIHFESVNFDIFIFRDLKSKSNKNILKLFNTKLFNTSQRSYFQLFRNRHYI